MTAAQVTEEKKPQTVPIDDDNDLDDSDEEGAPEIAAGDGQCHVASHYQRSNTNTSHDIFLFRCEQYFASYPRKLATQVR